MIREWINHAAGWIEERLRRLCGAISPDKRVFAVVTLFLLFAGLSLYTVVTVIYRIGRNDGQQLRTEHIRMPVAGYDGFRTNSTELTNDSDYGREQKTTE